MSDRKGSTTVVVLAKLTFLPSVIIIISFTRPARACPGACSEAARRDGSRAGRCSLLVKLRRTQQEGGRIILCPLLASWCSILVSLLKGVVNVGTCWALGLCQPKSFKR